MVPGPCEEFAHEATRLPTEILSVDHPCEPLRLDTYDTDWLVENMTPKLREWIMDRFQTDLITEPKYVPALGKFVGSRYLQECGSFISVFMRPQTMLGSAVAQTSPLHYYIPKGDVVAFMRRAEAQIEAAQQHLDLLQATTSALRGLLSKGKSEMDYINVMLPYAYDVFNEIEGVMCEVEAPMLPLGRTGGLNTVIIVDTGGPVGRQLTYVKAALKRALHAHMSAKHSFQMIRFLSKTGEPRRWSKHMTPPTDEAIQAAEDWIDGLMPAPGGQLLSAIHHALAHSACDEIFVVSGGSTDVAQHADILQDIRRLNTREVPIHCVGVNPEPMGELLLRNIAESNFGDFVSKSFKEASEVMKDPQHPAHMNPQDATLTSWRTHLVNDKTQALCDSFKKEQKTIGGQMRIIEVMQREKSRWADGWHRECQCAQRLLASQDRNMMEEMTKDEMKEARRRTSRTLSARVGGGFLYATGEREVGLEHLFEHKSAVPWTDNADTAATGPRVPQWDAGQGRLPRLPLDVNAPPPHPHGMGSFPTAGSVERRPPRPQSAHSLTGSASREKLPSIWKPNATTQLFGPPRVNPWGDACSGSQSSRLSEPRVSRPPSASRRGRGTSSTRMASADRAAGAQAASPAPRRRPRSRTKGRSKTPPPPTAERTRGPEAFSVPGFGLTSTTPRTLERRNSF